MKLPDLGLKLPDLPRPVAIASAAMVVSVFLFGVLYFTLGAGRDQAVEVNGRLTADLAQSQKNTKQVSEDFKYVSENQQKFEDLLQSERLVPHIRRAAVRQMQTLALRHGLNPRVFSYDFATAVDKAAVAAAAQAPAKPGAPAAAAALGAGPTYRINVESVTLKIGAPLDGQIYGFVRDLGTDFPGAAVVQSIDLQRPAKISSDVLNQLSRGEDSGVVTGEIKFLWRTAQANEPEKKP
jgi:hypothetical protein